VQANAKIKQRTKKEIIMTQDKLYDMFAELFQLSGKNALFQAIAIQNHFLNLWDFHQSAKLFSQTIQDSKKSYSHSMLIHLLDEHAKSFDKFSVEHQEKIKAFHSHLEDVHQKLSGP
jgi:hypothetical protein